MYDLIIIGAGPAGLSAAIHAKRFKLNFIVLERGMPGGQARVAHRIDNYPGFPNGVSGQELMDRFIEQAGSLGVEIIKCEAREVLETGGSFIIKTVTGGEFCSRAVLAATGLVPKKLSIERALYYPDPSSVSHAGKNILIIGGGDAAFDQAIAFSKMAGKVVIAMRSDKPCCTNRLYDEATSSGVDILTKIELEEAKRGLKPDILIVDIGKTPDFSIFKCKNIFFAGDIAHPGVRHVAVAVGNGVTAVEEIIKNEGYFKDR